MRLTLRIVCFMLLVVALVTGGFTALEFHRERVHLREEMDTQAQVVSDSLKPLVEPLLDPVHPVRLQEVADRFNAADPVLGIGLFSANGDPVGLSPSLSKADLAEGSTLRSALRTRVPASALISFEGKSIHIYAAPVIRDGSLLGAIVVAHEPGLLHSRLSEIGWDNAILLICLVAALVATLMFLLRRAVIDPISEVVDWMKGFRLSGPRGENPLPQGEIFGPLAAEVTRLAQNLSQARQAAQQEARLRDSAQSLWTAARLKQHILQKLGGRTLFLVSNREPYMHVEEGRKVNCIIPAGGVVTALDPVMRACGGTWIAHGSGNADRANSDAHGRVRVPPQEPSYTLRRVWLSSDEENGYYYGFCNEGFWPLCHIVYTRPIFRLEDWEDFKRANERFAEAVLEEIESEEDPLVLVQDFHLALLPSLIKKRRPDAKVGLFWHVPWPNPEAFGICPWKVEILEGMLGADLIGFHTQYHCNNFLDTVDQTLESKINWDRFTVQRGGQETLVEPYPIGVAFPDPEGMKMQSVDIAAEKAAALSELKIKAEFIGVGVDRIDYTKGLLERFQAIQRLLEKYPEYVGRFTFVELGAPSRTVIKRYAELGVELDAIVARINQRYATDTWRPIVFWKDHHGHQRINQYYRVAQVCMVTSLHDGMNLVAKEYIAARSQEDGVLMLSQFTGAARELPQAMIVNPYDIEGMADTLHAALQMPVQEQKLRMTAMRTTIRENNVYRWAGSLVTALTRLSTEHLGNRPRLARRLFLLEAPQEKVIPE